MITMPASPSARIHAALGSPVGPECTGLVSFVCWICGAEAARGRLRRSWMGVTFVGQNRVRAPDSDWVCEACVVCMAGKPPDTFRMTSHLVDDRGWLRPNKGDKTGMRAWLRGPKTGEWFAAVADSGKKHLIPWAPMNTAGAWGRVLFEERVVSLGDWGLLDAMTCLLSSGVRKEEIDRGEYGPRAWVLAGREAIGSFERRWGALRSGGWFDLGLWLSQREENADADR